MKYLCLTRYPSQSSGFAHFPIDDRCAGFYDGIVAIYFSYPAERPIRSQRMYKGSTFGLTNAFGEESFFRQYRYGWRALFNSASAFFDYFDDYDDDDDNGRL